MWKWEENSILYSSSPYTPTKDVFQAVCSELGRFYQEKGLNYQKSKRQLKWQGTHLRCEFGFWSSHSNIRGEWVNLEIVTSLFAVDSSQMERKGILSFGIRPKNFNVYQIDEKKFFEITSFLDKTLDEVKKLETKDGLEALFSTTSRAKMVEKNANHLEYFKQLGLEG